MEVERSGVDLTTSCLESNTLNITSASHIFIVFLSCHVMLCLYVCNVVVTPVVGFHLPQMMLTSSS